MSNNHFHKVKQLGNFYKREFLENKKRKDEDVRVIPRLLNLPGATFTEYTEQERAQYSARPAKRQKSQ